MTTDDDHALRMGVAVLRDAAWETTRCLNHVTIEDFSIQGAFFHRIWASRSSLRGASISHTWPRSHPFPSRFIYRTPPLGDSARSLLYKKPIKTELSQRQGNYDTFRGKNLFLKIKLLGKGLTQGIRGDRGSS